MTRERAARAQIETKVIAGGLGAGAGAIVSQFLVYLLAVWPYGAGGEVSSVPDEVAAFVGLVVTSAGALGAAYWAPHTHRRPDPDAGGQLVVGTPEYRAGGVIDAPTRALGVVPVDRDDP